MERMINYLNDNSLYLVVNNIFSVIECKGSHR